MSTLAVSSAGIHLLRIGRVGLQKRILNDDGQAEGNQERGQTVIAQNLVQDSAQQRRFDCGHGRHNDQQRRQRVQANGGGHRQSEIGGENDEITVGDVDEPHDAEDQREPGGEEREKAAEERPLNEGIQPFHGYSIPEQARLIASRETSPEEPSGDTRPSCRQ